MSKITTHKEYELALLKLEQVFNFNNEVELNYFEQLANEVEEYENIHFPIGKKEIILSESIKFAEWLRNNTTHQKGIDWVFNNKWNSTAELYKIYRNE